MQIDIKTFKIKKLSNITKYCGYIIFYHFFKYIFENFIIFIFLEEKKTPDKVY